jgi:iron only hydrogenase large subunit-like protein
MEVRIASSSPATVPGEILARGTNVMLGYYKNPEATKQALDKDGWYHTGDLGTMNADGHIFILGRIKNMLLGPSGQNIYPEEIEDKLSSMPMVNECIVVQRGEKLVAMVAPAADRQFPGTMEQLLAACVKAGFADVVEVALGAEKTTRHETEEFLERMERDPKTFMTTSCCPAYVNLVGKHLPELVEHVSLTPSPMVYAHEMVRERDPGAKTVFIGPCVAKRSEAKRKGVDFVLSFEELGAILAGRKIDVIACEAHPVERPASASARNFARSCGVTEAVLAEATSKIPDFQLAAKQIDGIDRKTCAMLKLYAAGKLPANFLEVMACPGGCVNGPCSLA